MYLTTNNHLNFQDFWKDQTISNEAIDAHSALKLEKSAISKVQKHIICIFKNGKKSIFAPEKSPKIAFLLVLNFFLVQKLIFFTIFEIANNVFLYF